MRISQGRRASRLKETKRLLDQFDAFVILSRSFNSDQRRQSNELRKRLEFSSYAELEEIVSQLSDRLVSCRTVLKPIRSNAYYADVIARQSIEDDQLMFIPKWELLALLPGLSQTLPGMAIFPQHAQLSVDLHGILPPDAPGEVRILEASVFEDLCVFVNRAVSLGPDAAKFPMKRAVIKEVAAMRRAAVLSSFYFVETYLNSIAFDYLIANHDKISVPDYDRLAEWDSKSNRVRFVSFRDKLLHYPRIILGKSTPLFQETNNRDVKYLLEEAKAFRDAIVHTNPRPDAGTFIPDKDLRFWTIGSAHSLTLPGGHKTDHHAWRRVVEAALSVVRLVEHAIHGSLERLYWLHDPDAEGLFPPEVFD